VHYGRSEMAQFYRAQVRLQQNDIAIRLDSDPHQRSSPAWPAQQNGLHSQKDRERTAVDRERAARYRRLLPTLIASVFVGWKIYAGLVTNDQTVNVGAPKVRARFVVHQSVVHAFGVHAQLEEADARARAKAAKEWSCESHQVRLQRPEVVRAGTARVAEPDERIEAAASEGGKPEE